MQKNLDISDIFCTFALEIKQLNDMKRLLFILLLALSASTYARPPYGMRYLTEEEKASWQHKKDSMVNLLVDATLSIVDDDVLYNPSYVKIPYPMGDVPAGTGVCSDVVIRAFRKGLGIDLQKEIYEFRKWQRDNLGKDIVIDRNIDHRRVRNMIELFDRNLSSNDATHPDFDGFFGRDLTKCEKGDVIVFDLGSGVLHIAICISDTEMVHNICCGQTIAKIADYSYAKIIRNYRLKIPDYIPDTTSF
jgi:uncharacterized protein YijF (DUF1287 family)